jgi:hypothetical protein
MPVACSLSQLALGTLLLLKARLVRLRDLDVFRSQSVAVGAVARI